MSLSISSSTSSSSSDSDSSFTFEIRPQSSPVSVKQQKKKRQDKTIINPDETQVQGGNEPLVVENIIRKATIDDKDCYFVKWVGLPSSENSWEAAKHLNVDRGIVTRFEYKWAKEHEPAPSTAGVNKKKIASLPQIIKEVQKGQIKEVLTTIPSGKVPKRVCNVQFLPKSNKLLYLIEWKKKKSSIRPDSESDPRENTDWISAPPIQLHYPQLVLDFYQSLISWKTESRSESVIQGLAAKALAEADARKDAAANATNLKGKKNQKLSCGVGGKIIILDSSSDSHEEEVTEINKKKNSGKIPILESEVPTSMDEAEASSSDDDDFKPINIKRLKHTFN